MYEKLTNAIVNMREKEAIDLAKELLCSKAVDPFVMFEHCTEPGRPDAAEKGYPKASFAVSLGLGGPKKLPAPILDKLQKAMDRTLKDPKVVEIVEKLDGVVIDYKNGTDYYNELMANAGAFKEIAATRPKK